MSCILLECLNFILLIRNIVYIIWSFLYIVSYFIEVFLESLDLNIKEEII